MLQEAYKEYGSFDAIADAIGGADRSTLARWWHHHGLPALSHGPDPKNATNKEALKRLAQKVYGNNGTS